MKAAPALCLAALLPFLLTPAAHGADTTLDDCRALAEPNARLACYDRVIGGTVRSEESAPDPAIVDKAPASPSTPATPAVADEPPAPRTDTAEAQDDGPAWKGLFGKREPRERKERREIRSQIVKVEQSPRRHDILTLANGQVWMENEPSARALEPGPEVVIREERFSYTMILESGRLLKVHRVR